MFKDTKEVNNRGVVILPLFLLVTSAKTPLLPFLLLAGVFSRPPAAASVAVLPGLSLKMRGKNDWAARVTALARLLLLERIFSSEWASWEKSLRL